MPRSSTARSSQSMEAARCWAAIPRPPLLARVSPGRDLLKRPAVAVGVEEEDEVAPWELVHVDGLDPEPAQIAPGLGGAGHDEVGSREAAWLRFGDAGADRDRARRSGRGELHEAKLVAHLVVVVEVKADLLVERLGAIHVAHRHRDELELEIHSSSFP